MNTSPKILSNRNISNESLTKPERETGLLAVQKSESASFSEIN
jgi:hypothetical protein